MAKDTLITKLGKTRAGERSRIWIEGPRLEAAGFRVGIPFVKTWDKDAGTLTLSTRVPKDAPRTSTGTVTGKGEKPIIDIIGKTVVEYFSSGTHVKADYYKGRIVIVKAAQE